VNNPFPHCHIVTTTTHKSLRGPRAGVIFFRKDPPIAIVRVSSTSGTTAPAATNASTASTTGTTTTTASTTTASAKTAAEKEPRLGLEEAINFSVFPSIQGGPHNNSIAAIAVQLREVNTPEFHAYARQIIANARALARSLVDRGHRIVTGGTDNHLLLWDVSPHGINGYFMQTLCDHVSITLNKNTIPGDRNALSPSGVRVGTPALTSRGFVEKDFVKVADFLDSACTLAKDIKRSLGTGATLNAFKAAVSSSAPVRSLRTEIENFARNFYMPGFDVATLRYRD